MKYILFKNLFGKVEEDNGGNDLAETIVSAGIRFPKSVLVGLTVF